MDIAFEEEDGVTTALLQGRLDTNTSPQAGEELMARVNSNTQGLVINLSETVFISSSGLRILLQCAKLMKRQDRKLALCCANEQNLEVLEISGFLTLMDHHATLESALTAVRG